MGDTSVKAKFKIYLTEKFYAILTINLEIPSEQRAVAELYGSNEQEQQNLVGQKIQEFLYLLGNTDEA